MANFMGSDVSMQDLVLREMQPILTSTGIGCKEAACKSIKFHAHTSTVCVTCFRITLRNQVDITEIIKSTIGQSLKHYRIAQMAFKSITSS